MRAPLLIAVVAGVPLVVIVIVTWVWITMPPALDPDALPARVLEPPSPAWRDAVEEGRSLARAAVAEEKLPGLSVAVAVDGAIVWAEGFRWADMESQTPVTPATRFRIGGISATLTAAAVGLLSERDLLDPDAPVRHYVPSFPEKRWPVTTRQLMSHTGGITPFRGEGGIIRGPGCENDADRIAIFAGDSLRFRPGTDRRYSTYGWVLVGAVVAAAADESYLGFVRREILEPLGMESTGPDAAGGTESDRARFYYPRMMLSPRYGLQDAPVVDLSCHLPAVGFLSTPSDLVRFGAAMMRDRLLSRETVAQLEEPSRLESDAPAEQALGWIVRTIPMGTDSIATRIVGQGLGEVVLRRPLSVQTTGGQVAGSTASLILVPEHDVAVAVASNVTGAESVPSLATELADLVVRRLRSRR